MVKRHNERERTAIDNEKAEEYAKINNAYKNVFGTPDGKIVLDDILSKGFLWATTFTGNSYTYFNEGKRDLALYVLKRTNTADPNIIMAMMKNNIKLKLERTAKKK